MAAALGCEGPLGHHICGQSFRVIGGELTQRRECRSSHRLRRAIASQPHHLKTLRSRGRLDIRAGRNLNNGQPLRIPGQIPKNSQESGDGRFVTGKEVDPKRYYTPEDCRRLELPKYLEAERIAKASLKHWASYNVWVQASFIDVAYNVPSALAAGTGMARLANAGDLDDGAQRRRR